MEGGMGRGGWVGGEVRRVTVLLSDLRGFTTISERLPPETVSEMMNEYFTAMVDVILAHRGLVQDFIGDAIMAGFGAPLHEPEHCWHAARSAHGMHASLPGLNHRWEADVPGPLPVVCVVHSRPAVSGSP